MVLVQNNAISVNLTPCIQKCKLIFTEKLKNKKGYSNEYPFLVDFISPSNYYCCSKVILLYLYFNGKNGTNQCTKS